MRAGVTVWGGRGQSRRRADDAREENTLAARRRGRTVDHQAACVKIPVLLPAQVHVKA